jgi:hypothetical protein
MKRWLLRWSIEEASRSDTRRRIDCFTVNYPLCNAGPVSLPGQSAGNPQSSIRQTVQIARDEKAGLSNGAVAGLWKDACGLESSMVLNLVDRRNLPISTTNRDDSKL